MLFELRDNPLMLTDCYNLSHQSLKINTDWEVSHIYNRSAPMILFGFNETVYNLLSDLVIDDWMVKDAENRAKSMGLSFPTELWMSVVDDLEGKIPLEIEALTEGTWVPRGTPFAQIRNTIKGYGELVTWWEGVLLHAYFPSACATEAYYAREYLIDTQRKYNYDDSFLWRFHSFGFRGHRSLEDAYWASSAWNLFLKGTDDFMSAYHTHADIIGSIPALAHKVTQQFDNEMACYMHAVDATRDSGGKIVAMVIDTYDTQRFIDKYAVTIANYASQYGIKVIFRPDSGDVINQAMEIYTKCVEVAGCKNTGVIVGMDMSFDRAKTYDAQLTISNVPLNYVSYGIGAGYYKHLERDTLGWSMKTAYSNGAPRMKFSGDPIKQSIPGVVDLIYDKDWNMIVFTRDEAKKMEFYNDLKLYETIYYYDKNIHHRPPPLWRQAYEMVQNVDSHQKNIILSNGIKELTEQIRLIHDLDAR